MWKTWWCRWICLGNIDWLKPPDVAGSLRKYYCVCHIFVTLLVWHNKHCTVAPLYISDWTTFWQFTCYQMFHWLKDNVINTETLLLHLHTCIFKKCYFYLKIQILFNFIFHYSNFVVLRMLAVWGLTAKALWFQEFVRSLCKSTMYGGCAVSKVS